MKLSSLSLVKYALAAVLTLLFGTAYSQYPATGNKQRLGWQTTGDGLVYRGAIADTSTLDPSGLNNAWMLLDTASGNLYAYRIKAWRLVSGGGGGGGVSMPFDSVTFNINEGDASEQELKYSADKGYLQYGGLDSVQIPLLPGIWYVRNDTSVTIPKGTVVRATGTLGASGRIKVKHMIANGSIPAMYVLGIAMQDIAVGADGYVMTQGKIRQVNTTAYSEGAVLYADVDTLGGLTQTEPGNGYLKLPIAFVVHSASNGTLAVRIDPGSSLHDLHDVDTTGRVNGSVLRYDSALKYWKASTTAGILASDTSTFVRQYQLSGTSGYLPRYTSDTTMGNSVVYQHSGNIGINSTIATNNKFQIGDVGSTGYAGNDLAIGNGTGVMAIEQTSTLTKIVTNKDFSFMPAGVGATGRVGIGTTSPARSLHIAATDAVRIPVGTDLGGVSDNGDIRFNTTANNFEWYSTTSGAWRKPVISASATGLGTDGRLFYANSSGLAAADEPLHWDYNNNRLGIGVASPTAPLDVLGGGKFSTVIEVPNIRNGTTANNVLTLAGNAAASGNTATSENIAFNVGNNGATRAMTILNNGRVGIGTASPSEVLQVNGTARATRFTVNTYRTEALSINNYGPPEAGAPWGFNVWIGNGGQSSTWTSGVQGGQNVGIGNGALLNNTTGFSNFALGLDAMKLNTTGSLNVAIGSTALFENTTGSGNIAIGALALGNSTGQQNTAIGADANIGTDGSYNLALGYFVQREKTSGDFDVAIGRMAGRYVSNGGASVTTSNQNVYIGADTYAGADNRTNQVVIGFRAVGNGSNTTTIGNSSTTATYIPAGKMYVGGTTAPTATLHLPAGTSSANTAPLKFTSGTNLTTAEAGAVEWNGTNLFITTSTPTRQTVNQGLTGSATIDFLSTNAQNSRDVTVTVTGASDGDVVALGVPNAAVNANTCYTAWVSATNTVTVRFNNYSSAAVDPAQGNFKIFVTKF